MKILALNCGSSTLKFRLLETGEGSDALGDDRGLARGVVEHIGGLGAVIFRIEGGPATREAATLADHGEATRRVIARLITSGLVGSDGLDAIGHRVVHGGDRLVAPSLIDEEVLRVLEATSELSPLHNLPAIAAIREARAVLGPDVPMVAVFDTAFHHEMPARAARYAIPLELAEPHRIRRYGFHGLAHRAMTERYAALTATAPDRVRLVTLQLGHGCSAAAVDAGRSVDTSMGLTPLEGLMMGTRSGDVDPSLAGLLARREGVNVGEVEGWLNTQSGLLGVSGTSGDMRDLLVAERRRDARAALAVEMFCYRVCKYIGAYLAALGGAHAVVFGGGIGEHAASIRARICAGMVWCGLNLDPERNAAAIGAEGRISTDDSTLHAYVIPVDEEWLIAGDTVRCLRAHRV
jgi:acetate kinase